MSLGLSIVQDCGTYQSTCGYCKHDRESSAVHGKHSHGMFAHNLTVEAYQELIDQGWRRSGTYLYKPDNVKTCCKQYTIRLHVPDFQPTKSQRKLLRKWHRYLAGEHVGHEHEAGRMEVDDVAEAQHRTADASSKRGRPDSNGRAAAAGNAADSDAGSSLASSMDAGVVQMLLQQAWKALVATGRLPAVTCPFPKVHQPSAKQLKTLPDGTCLTCPAAFALAAAARKQQPQHAASLQADAVAEALAGAFNARAASAMQLGCSCRAAAAHGHINFMRDTIGDEPAEAVTKEQASSTPISPVQHQQQQEQEQHHQQRQQHHQQQPGTAAAKEQHERRASHAQASSGCHDTHAAAGMPHSLEIRMVPSTFIKEEFELYCKYQMAQHGDEPWELRSSSYKRFLVDSPLLQVPPPAQLAAAAGTADEESSGTDGNSRGEDSGAAGSSDAGRGDGGMPDCGYGSFHQQYWLDGRLIAVGVVDILPRCLSSVYLFWDPDFAFLAPGKFSALEEINWVANAAKQAPDLRYYYMGYYIHTCPKMRYKADYRPSELLCPERLVWVTIDQGLLAALDAERYVAFSRVPGAKVAPNLSLPTPQQQEQQQQQRQQQQPTELLAAIKPKRGKRQGHQSHQQAEAAHEATSTGEGWSLRAGAHRPPPASLEEQLIYAASQLSSWGAVKRLKQGPLLHVQRVEARMLEWMAVVGHTCRRLVYLLPGELGPA